MKFNANGIMKIAHGVVYVSEENDGIHLNRFTKELFMGFIHLTFIF